MVDTVTVSLDIAFGDFRLTCSRTIHGSAWRNKPVAMLEAELSQMLIQVLAPAVAAYDDAQRGARPS